MNLIFNAAKLALASGQIQYLTDTIKVMLVTDVYTPDIDAHLYLSDILNIAGAQAEGAGYVSGGKALVNKSISSDLITNRTAWKADNLTWATSTLRVRGAVIYKDTGVAGSSLLLIY